MVYDIGKVRRALNRGCEASLQSRLGVGCKLLAAFQQKRPARAGCTCAGVRRRDLLSCPVTTTGYGGHLLPVGARCSVLGGRLNLSTSKELKTEKKRPYCGPLASITTRPVGPGGLSRIPQGGKPLLVRMSLPTSPTWLGRRPRRTHGPRGRASARSAGLAV